MDFELAVIRTFTTHLPPVRGAGYIAEQLLRRVYLRRPRPTVEAEALGLKLELDPHQAMDAGLLLYPQIYNRQEFHWLRTRLTPGELFVDVGAYIGIYALVAAGITDRVVAIEANPDIYTKLMANIRRNGLPVSAVNNGVSDARETLPFYRQEHGNLGGSSFVFTHGATPIQIECLPLADIAPHGDFLKLDVEGMEARVLTPYLARFRPHTMILEVSHDQAVVDLCRRHGYRLARESSENVLLTATE